jgi:hypothetical protein
VVCDPQEGFGLVPINYIAFDILEESQYKGAVGLKKQTIFL